MDIRIRKEIQSAATLLHWSKMMSFYFSAAIWQTICNICAAGLDKSYKWTISMSHNLQSIKESHNSAKNAEEITGAVETNFKKI